MLRERAGGCPHEGQILRSLSEPGARRPHSSSSHPSVGHAPHHAPHPLCRNNEVGGLEGRSDVASDGPKGKAVSQLLPVCE